MTTQTHDEIARITHADARRVGELADAQLIDLLERLDDDHWDAPTDCEGWSVADIVGHLIGAAKGNASLRRGLADQIWGMRHADAFDGNGLDALNARQVRDHAHLSPAQRVAALREWRPRALARTRLPRVLGLLPIPLGGDKGSYPTGIQTTISLGQLMDVVYTRDVWLHTVDIERATGVKADRSGEVDRILVHDAVADWLGLHGQPVGLHLGGPAGGDFRQGTGGPELTLDALEWARIVSGRAPAEGLLAQPVLF